MIIIMKPEVDLSGPEITRVLEYLRQFPDIKTKVSEISGVSRAVIEIYLIGQTHNVPAETIERMPGVEKVVRVSNKYKLIGRHGGQLDQIGFEYNGLYFDQDSLHTFIGPCAVDTPEHVEIILKNLQKAGVTTARMGAYKPRTSPYDFQGHGKSCLPWVFDLAGKYGIKVIAMEILKEDHIDEINDALEKAGRPTGVMLQIGTRNAQNFELLKAAGSQQEFPVLYKRGMGLSLEEALNACEYIASSGNRKIIFCLRGVKTRLGEPHRNLVDFIHVPVIKRLTRLPVCIDPTHSIGTRDRAADGILDIFHATAQGVIAGANMILVEFHPRPELALCDGPQALTMKELEYFLEDIKITRKAYEERKALASREIFKEWHTDN
ncbi:MAG: 3-deoxy-7-phosphoheptulonate synthase [Dissulfurimicrobium sp.]|uniref:3-deoxy-7-phosphoheptulonate synthase n=1 Tax=Dissulfurimicrobium sp. TaxID=2022436 RepID=UPI00404B6893